MEPLKLAIIEDEEAHFQLMKRAIGKDFPLASLHHFEEAASCLKTLDEINPDVIISDYLMPGINGLDFLEALKQENKDIPVIVITGQGDENVAVQAMKLGARDYLVKSTDFLVLLPSAIKKVIREQKLKESFERSEKRFKQIFTESPIGIELYDSDGQLIDINKSCVDIFGISDAADVKGFDLFADPNVASQYKARLAKGETVRYEVAFDFEKVKKLKLYKTTRSGIMHLDVLVTPMDYRTDHRAGGYLVQIQDITDRTRTEEALRESEKKYSTLVESSIIGICIIQDAKIVFANERLAQVYGYSRDEVSGMESSRLVHPEDRAFVKEIRTKRLKGEKVPSEYEVRGLRKDGETIWVVRRNTSMEYRGRPAVLGNIVDITKRKCAEEQIRSLSHQLIAAQESEQQRISYELHDVVGQELSALGIGLSTLFDGHPKAPPEMRQRLSELSKILQGAITGVRNLSHTLRSTGLDQRGLVPTARLYCEKFSHKHGVKVEFSAAGIDESKLDFHIKINLYRVIQEGLNNIKKHTDARHVSVQLLGSFPNIILRIEDDGKGFDVQNRLVSAANEGRMGLRIMEERVALLQGKIRIESRPMRGTKILINVPCKRKDNSQKENDLDF